MNQLSYTYNEELYLIPEKTTVIISQPWATVEEAELALLQKILSAVRLSIDSVRVIQQPALDLAALSPLPARLIYFGPAVNGLVQYEVIRTEQSALVMAAPLKELQSDQAAKQKLWQALRQQYGI